MQHPVVPEASMHIRCGDRSVNSSLTPAGSSTRRLPARVRNRPGRWCSGGSEGSGFRVPRILTTAASRGRMAKKSTYVRGLQKWRIRWHASGGFRCYRGPNCDRLHGLDGPSMQQVDDGSRYRETALRIRDGRQRPAMESSRLVSIAGRFGRTSRRRPCTRRVRRSGSIRRLTLYGRDLVFVDYLNAYDRAGTEGA